MTTGVLCSLERIWGGICWYRKDSDSCSFVVVVVAVGSDDNNMVQSCFLWIVTVWHERGGILRKEGGDCQ